MTLTLELWQAGTLFGAYGAAIIWLMRLQHRAALTAKDLKKHEDGCSARYAEMSRQRTEDMELATSHRHEDREWMKAISKKLDRLVERESGVG